jgi:hypothetical protein
VVTRMLVGALFGGRAAEAAPAVDLKVLHAKIGERREDLRTTPLEAGAAGYPAGYLADLSTR